MTLLQRLIQYLFPATCVVCDKPTEKIHVACLRFLESPYPTPHSWIFSCFSYRDVRLKKLIRHVKNKRDVSLAETFGKVLYEKFLEESEDLELFYNFTNPLVIPVPASRERMSVYGFNQAELLAEYFCAMFTGDFAERGRRVILKNAIKRIKKIPKQALISNRKQRLHNPTGAFGFAKSALNNIKNRNIILIDDVTTTGATLSEIRKVLLKAGARNVIAITVGH